MSFEINNEILTKNCNINELIEEVRKGIKKKGYFIAKKALSENCYKKCRSEVINFFSEEYHNLPKALRGNISAGMGDFLGYSNNRAWKIFRYCAFPWNRPNKKLEFTIKVSRYLSSLRNLINQKNYDYGLSIESNNYITYTSISNYDSNGGFLKKHKDSLLSKNEKSLIHFKVELTHKNIDYEDGGMTILDKNDTTVKLSEMCEPMDVIFFDGKFAHEILPTKSKSLGRIAFFDIPTFVKSKSRKSSYSGYTTNFLLKIIEKIRTS